MMRIVSWFVLGWVVGLLAGCSSAASHPPDDARDGGVRPVAADGGGTGPVAADAAVPVDAPAEAFAPGPPVPVVDASSDGQAPLDDASAGATVKWAPGYYVLTDTQYEPGKPFSQWQPELDDAVAAKPTVQGFALFTTWAGLEWKTEANWQFGGGVGSTFVIDQIASFCRTNGLKLALVINPDVFNSGTPSAPKLDGDNGNVPYYLLTDPATYGAGLYGNSSVTSTGASGFWVQQTGGFGANLENANVQARLIAMLQHLGAVFDGDPVLEAVIFDAMDVMYPFTGTGATGQPYYTAVQNIMTSMKGAFPTTNVAIQVAWGGTPMQSFVEWMVTHGIMVSTSDTAGLTGFQPGSGPTATTAAAPGGTSATLSAPWAHTTGDYAIAFSTGQEATARFTQSSTTVTWNPAVSGSPTHTIETAAYPPNLSDGVQAWMGTVAVAAGSSWSPPSPALMSYGTSFPLVEGGDFGGTNPYGTPYAIGDIIDAANQKYQASHLYVSHMASNQTNVTAAVWSNVLPVLQANPLVNVAYPAVYPK
jgi:hypothetical protein